jgi:predicted methyltransferase
MIRTKLLIAALLASALPFAAEALAPTAPPIVAAVADTTRPAADVALDAERKPADMLAFAGVKPGMTVVDLIPGGGYFTRLFADVVGPNGKVLPYVPDEMLKGSKDPAKALDRLNGTATGHPNVHPMHDPMLSPPPPGIADIVWTSQNYHDLHNISGADVVAFNKVMFTALKPGGVYIVLDHAAAPGSGLRDTNTLHRIDPAAVKSEVLAAGFVFDGESKVLANPADAHTLNVFDPSLRHRTDQFIYRFRKPKK